MAHTETKSPCLFIFGLGYTATTLALALQKKGWQIRTTYRDLRKRQKNEQNGFTSFHWTREHPLENPEKALQDVTHILHSVPTDQDGDPVYDRHGHDLSRLESLQWFGYLSTTGVYGNHDGRWVDETTEVNPSLARTERRVRAERQWLALAKDHGLPAHIFRLAGIYGPGRNPLEKLRQGKAHRIHKPGQVFSRIHVEDISGVLQKTMETPHPGEIFNLCDDVPEEPHLVIDYAASLLKLAPPPLIPIDSPKLSEMARSFYADNRRVKNEKMKKQLGYRLKFPDYKTGLNHIFETL